MRRSIDVDMECWFCDAPIEREAVEREGHLVPRRRSEGGPYYHYRCESCLRRCRVEKNRAGALIVTPPPSVPLVDSIMATFDPDLKLELERKRDYATRRKGRREWFFGLYADELWAEGVRPSADGGYARQGKTRAQARQERRRRQPQRKAKPKGRPRSEPDPQPDARPDPPPPEPPPQAEPEPPPPPPPPSPAPEPTPYEILGLEPGATRGEVQQAFRTLAKRYHPDRFETLDEDFRELAQAKFIRLKSACDELLERLPPDS
ncbi:MAG TPA: hypothetical protein DEA08_20915 [Planctomycetes bacterium]|nr:hypothetical protein [Planctomycetota bacterium]